MHSQHANTLANYKTPVIIKLSTMCLCHQTVQMSTGERAAKPHSWESNCRSGVALAMHHRLKWFIHLQAQWPKEGRWHFTYTMGYGTLYDK